MCPFQEQGEAQFGISIINTSRPTAQLQGVCSAIISLHMYSLVAAKGNCRDRACAEHLRKPNGTLQINGTI